MTENGTEIGHGSSWFRHGSDVVPGTLSSDVVPRFPGSRREPRNHVGNHVPGTSTEILDVVPAEPLRAEHGLSVSPEPGWDHPDREPAALFESAGQDSPSPEYRRLAAAVILSAYRDLQCPADAQMPLWAASSADRARKLARDFFASESADAAKIRAHWCGLVGIDPSVLVAWYREYEANPTVSEVCQCGCGTPFMVRVGRKGPSRRFVDNRHKSRAGMRAFRRRQAIGITPGGRLDHQLNLVRRSSEWQSDGDSRSAVVG